MASRIFSQSEVRGFDLSGLRIPPKNYDGFLADAAYKFERFVLAVGGYKTLEELASKFPNGRKHSEEQFPISIYATGWLDYGLTDVHRRRGTIGKSVKYFEDVISDVPSTCGIGSATIDVDNLGAGIEAIVTRFHNALDKRYPKRKGWLRTGFLADESDPIQNHLSEFRFTVNLSCDSVQGLRASISLEDNMVSHDGKISYFVPHIKITVMQAVKLAKLSPLPARLADRLGGLVMNHYKVSDVSFEKSYRKEL